MILRQEPRYPNLQRHGSLLYCSYGVSYLQSRRSHILWQPNSTISFLGSHIDLIRSVFLSIAITIASFESVAQAQKATSCFRSTSMLKRASCLLETLVNQIGYNSSGGDRHQNHEGYTRPHHLNMCPISSRTIFSHPPAIIYHAGLCIGNERIQGFESAWKATHEGKKAIVVLPKTVSAAELRLR